MKKNIPFLVLLFLLPSLYCFAQSALRLADEQYRLFNYYNAANFYEQAYVKKQTFYAAVQLANCFNKLHDYKNEESWYATAVTLAPQAAQPALILDYAKALQNNSKYAEAKQQYQKYAGLHSNIDKVRLDVLIASCDSAVKWMQNPQPVEVKNLLELNSKDSDFGAALYNKDLIFASDRSPEIPNRKPSRPFLKFDVSEKPDKKIYGWTGNGYLKLFSYNTFQKSVSRFFIDRNDYHIGPATFTADGNTAYFTITEIPKQLKKDNTGAKTVRIEIFSSTMDTKTRKWGQPVPFKFNNIQQWSVGDPFINPDGKCIYFVSDMPGGKGGTDIYYSLKDASGNWADAVNMADINTPGNERTPSKDTDGNFYYSSDGSITMGGLDIFEAIIKNNRLANIKNMGYPTNSPQDDFHFVSYNGGHTGYLSSNRDGGVGEDDIYSFRPKTEMKLLLEGYVYDKNTHMRLTNALVGLTTDSGSREQMASDTAGYFHFVLKRNNAYLLTGNKTNYTADAASLTTQGITTSQTITKDLYLEKIVINKPIVLKNINYDFDKANIRPDAQIELNKLVKIMKDNPTIWIELGSHTDSRGSDVYNLALSQRRAESAVDYLVKTGGINPNRITAHGYGETRLLNRCSNGVECSEAEHQVNRRTEFKITRQ